MASAASLRQLTLLFQPVLVRCSYCIFLWIMSGVPERESLLPGGQRRANAAPGMVILLIHQRKQWRDAGKFL